MQLFTATESQLLVVHYLKLVTITLHLSSYYRPVIYIYSLYSRYVYFSIACLYLGRLPKVDLIILEGEKCPSVRPYVRPSVHKKFLRFQ